MACAQTSYELGLWQEMCHYVTAHTGQIKALHVPVPSTVSIKIQPIFSKNI